MLAVMQIANGNISQVLMFVEANVFIPVSCLGFKMVIQLAKTGAFITEGGYIFNALL